MSDRGSDVDSADGEPDVRTRIVDAAGQLIASGGRDAATTRAVAAAAGVQPPTIYRLFGDKSGLLDAVAEYGVATYVAAKSACRPHPDPIQDLRNGWDVHISFGLTHPDLFAIMNGDPQRHRSSQALAAGRAVLRARVRRIARAGQLVLSKTRAVALIQAAGVGTVSILLSQSDDERDRGLADTAREAVIAAITGSDRNRTSSRGPQAAAATLQSCLEETSALTDGERHLLAELLERIANGATSSSAG